MVDKLAFAPDARESHHFAADLATLYKAPQTNRAAWSSSFHSSTIATTQVSTTYHWSYPILSDWPAGHFRLEEHATAASRLWLSWLAFRPGQN
jgi:hypothetical protein